MKNTAIIPARYNSTRFPGKPLASLLGKPIIQHVYERTRCAKMINKVIVATDDPRIEKTVISFGGEVVMTSGAHLSGSDRVAEVAEKIDTDIVINVQGDEPLIEPGLIDEICRTFENSDCEVVTARTPINDLNDFQNPNTVKVVCDKNGFALYFSRSRIPGSRDDVLIKPNTKPIFFKHIGIYGYTKRFLTMFPKLPPTPLELQEGLEQLRILEHGYKIRVIDTEYKSVSVDTPEDLEYLRILMAKEQ